MDTDIITARDQLSLPLPQSLAMAIILMPMDILDTMAMDTDIITARDQLSLPLPQSPAMAIILMAMDILDTMAMDTDIIMARDQLSLLLTQSPATAILMLMAMDIAMAIPITTEQHIPLIDMAVFQLSESNDLQSPQGWESNLKF